MNGQLPGHGTVYLGQTLKFMAPVRPGDMVRAIVTVTEIDYARRRVTLDTRCEVAGKVVLKGINATAGAKAAIEAAGGMVETAPGAAA